MNIPRGGYPMAARFAALTAATGTAAVTILLPMSSAARSMGNSILGEILVWLTLAATLLGWADLILHDIFGRLILPSLDMHLRHRVCVFLYHWLTAAWFLRAMVLFGSTTGQPIERFVIGSWYVWTGISTAILAVLIALDDR